MSEGVLLLYDDAAPVPADVGATTGVAAFGDLLRRRERLSDTVVRLGREAGLGELLHLRRGEDRGRLADAVRALPEDQRYFLLPSFLAPTAETADAVLFLRKIAVFGEPVALWHEDRPLVAGVVDRRGALAYLAAAALEDDAELERFVHEGLGVLPTVGDALGLTDLREASAALEFLSGSFSARHFNQIADDGLEVVKHSADRDKIRREHAYYQLLPEHLQPYFLQPYDFRDGPGGASYRTRRLFVPDLAVQWVHGVFSEAQFGQLVTRLLHFVDERPRREVGRKAAMAVAHDLYVGKTRRRVDDLLALDAGQRVDAVLVAGGVDGGVRGLLERYERLYDRLAPRRRETELVVSHGDLGFSNVLYSPGTQDFQLIDPRGAESEDELYSDRLYDVAKLSHSVLGSYDLLVAGLFDLVFDEELGLELRIAPAPPAALQELFARELAGHDFDLRAVRLGEAALFLSMLPLHIEVPQRVVALALVARGIIDDVERAAA